VDKNKFKKQGVAALKAMFKAFNIEDAVVDGHKGLITKAMGQEELQFFIVELLYVQLKLSKAIMGIYISCKNSGNEEFTLAKHFHGALITNADETLEAFMRGFADGDICKRVEEEK